MESTRRIDALTGLRPFASFYVFFFHFGRPLVATWPPWARSLAGSGYVGVSFFYVLSGFVLAVSYRSRIAAGDFSHRRFLARRLSRLVPAYLFALALLMPLSLGPDGGVHTSALGGLLQVAMLQAWWPPVALSWNLPAWSVSVELALYLVLPTLIRALSRLPSRQRVALLAVTWAASLAIAGGYSALAPDGIVGPDSDAFFLGFVKFWPPARLPELAFGVTLGLLYDRERGAPAWLGPAAVAATAALLAVADRLPFALVHNALLLPCFGALVWSVAAARGAVARVLGAPALYRLGRASYAVYILQMPLMYLVLAAKLPLAGARFFVVFAALVYAVGLAFHLAIEQRASSFLQGCWSKRAASANGRNMERFFV
ncbi:MAG: acyltransferase family protein [Polyangia bacterium]